MKAYKSCLPPKPFVLSLSKHERRWLAITLFSVDALANGKALNGEKPSKFCEHSDRFTFVNEHSLK
jgi:hypothetical protein